MRLGTVTSLSLSGSAALFVPKSLDTGLPFRWSCSRRNVGMRPPYGTWSEVNYLASVHPAGSGASGQGSQKSGCQRGTLDHAGDAHVLLSRVRTTADGSEAVEYRDA